MIKVPASRAGLPAVRQLTSEGINVNITLLFGVDRYEEVARAYMDGLSIFIANGGDATRVSSVASFFVSRIDTVIDDMVTRRVGQANDASERARLTGLFGRVAIANARLAYQRYLTLCRTPAWQALAAKGARPQRLLWASTSTEERSISRCSLRGGTDRPRHCDNRHTENNRGVPRPRPTASQSRRGPR